MLYLIGLIITMLLVYTETGHMILGTAILFIGLVLKILFTTWVGMVLLIVVVSKIGG